MQRLGRIVKEARATVVLSSTWRTSSYTLKLVNQQLEKHGMEPCSDVTPEIPSRGQIVRVQEIYSWLHAYEGEIHSWIAIDDINLAHREEERMENHFVHTDSNTGITEEHVELAVQLLSTPPPWTLLPLE
eukprot:TRINITY_DN555_c1_g1_i2.p1 TRINITY_DN555_c1_g1~~TRINITY_DN555_c1_g1_i2.p1  ORF type:complete len:130 (-),score=18.22 TRINITY_DN555_c1_g1_i2:117-506(-)